MSKLWNVSDDPKSDVRPRAMLMMGSLVKPGEFVEVPDYRIAAAKRMSQKPGIFFGDDLPRSYKYGKGSFVAEPISATKGHVAPKGTEAAKGTSKKPYVKTKGPKSRKS